MVTPGVVMGQAGRSVVFGVRVLAAAVLGLCALVALQSCEVVPGSVSSTLVWYVSPSGAVQTNDLARLQKEVPFSITLPRYLPEGFAGRLPSLYYVPSDRQIRAVYQGVSTSAPQIMDVIEMDGGPTWVPNDQIDSTLLEYDGCRVIEERLINTVPWNGQPSQRAELKYVWNRNNISLSVSLIGYDSGEGRKVIRSMID